MDSSHAVSAAGWNPEIGLPADRRAGSRTMPSGIPIGCTGTAGFEFTAA